VDTAVAVRKSQQQVALAVVVTLMALLQYLAHLVQLTKVAQVDLAQVQEQMAAQAAVVVQIRQAQLVLTQSLALAALV
jgi:hypothetical protein